MSLRDVILTLQYCLETFEATCQCGRCDSCTKGQGAIRNAISAAQGTGTFTMRRRRRCCSLRLVPACRSPFSIAKFRH